VFGGGGGGGGSAAETYRVRRHKVALWVQSIYQLALRIAEVAHSEEKEEER
jgi:hypothetical protein